jgi:2-desacetyl-2-hydroxyethyl bacteriochlorophyllide A dehydrogenase
VKALQLVAPGQVELVEIDPPIPSDGHLLVKTAVSLICTSDLNDIRSNVFGVGLPVVLGHEAAGTVVEVGAGVKGFQPGMRVAAHPVHPCLECPTCLEGLGHLCPSMKHFGINMQGTFAGFFVVRADRARVLPAGVSLEAAALAEPVCVCLEALARARLDEGQSLLIVGDGPFGVLMARLAAGLPLRKVVIAGHHDFRLSASGVAVQVNTTGATDARARLLAETDGRGYDAVILAVGSAPAAADGLALLKARGRLVVFSAVPGGAPVDLFSLHVRELEIVGACNDQDRLDEALARLEDAALGLDALVTHELPLERYEEALRLAGSGHERALKVGFRFDEEARV